MALAFNPPEADFEDQVRSDLTNFVKSAPFDSVLVFPPVNSFYRFLIHQLVQDSFDQLRTFSIGEDPDRRIVVCTKDLVARVDASKDEPQPSVRTEAAPSKLTMVFSDAERSDSSQVRKSRSSLPTIGIYRPPAARRSTEESPKLIISPAPESTNVESPAKNAAKSARPRVRRPDQQVYVPRAKRVFKDSERFEDASVLDNLSSSQVSASETSNVREKPRSPSLIIEEKKIPKQRSFSPTGAFHSLPPRASQLVETKKKLCQSTSSDLDLEGIGGNISVESERSSSTMTSTQPVNLPPRAEVLVEKKKKLCQSNSLTEDYKWQTSQDDDQENNKQISADSGAHIEQPKKDNITVFSKSKNLLVITNSEIASVIDLEVTSINTVSESEKKCDNVKVDGSVVENCSVSIVNSRTLHDSDLPLSMEKSAKRRLRSPTGFRPIHSAADNCNIPAVISRTFDDSDVSQNIKETSKPRSRSPAGFHRIHDSASQLVECKDNCESAVSKRVNQRAESSDDDYHDAHNEDKSNCPDDMSDSSSGGSSESLSSSDSVNASVSPVQLMKPVKSETKKKSSSKPAKVFNPDECDWDALLDEDVLDPFLMKELTSAVGEVQVTQPKSDYRIYRSQAPADSQRTRRSTADEDFGHVVEIFSFPPEFKTNDLVAVLSPFKNTAGGFEIKWVDDTHALGVFASALVAEQVLAYQHPMVRMRPLSEATLESRLKARKLSESIQSFRPRPETCAALARRLVTGALGVKLPTARQEREEEKRVLREAREKRRLAVQQQDDIWNS